MTNLFLCSISPVQNYISKSRKLSDLCAGSKILSKLSLELASEIIYNYDYNLIYPSNLRTESFPNQFLLEGEYSLNTGEFDLERYWKEILNFKEL